MALDPPAERCCINIISFVIKVLEECCIDWYNANVFPCLLSGEDTTPFLWIFEIHTAFSEVCVSYYQDILEMKMTGKYVLYS